MDEWQKILLSVATGFLAGVISEPIKQFLTKKIKASHVRSALYMEIAHNHLALSNGQHWLQKKNLGIAQECFDDLTTAVYDLLVKTDILTVVHLQEYLALMEVYARLKRFIEYARNAKWDTNVVEVMETICGSAIAKIDSELVLGRIRASAFERCKEQIKINHYDPLDRLAKRVKEMPQ